MVFTVSNSLRVTTQKTIVSKQYQIDTFFFYIKIVKRKFEVLINVRFDYSIVPKGLTFYSVWLDIFIVYGKAKESVKEMQGLYNVRLEHSIGFKSNMLFLIHFHSKGKISKSYNFKFDELLNP